MHYLGIDWGKKRIGLSYSDDLGVAVPLPAIVTSDKQVRLSNLTQVICDRKIDAIVIGYPYTLKGAIGQRAREVDAFIIELQVFVKVPINRYDERFSTNYAEQSAQTFGLKDDRRSGRSDSRAATLILQDFLTDIL